MDWYVQWDGSNLSEVLEFTGRHPKFDEWFQSFDQFKTYVQNDGNVFKLFYGDGSKVHVNVGDYLVKRLDGIVDAYETLPSIQPTGVTRPDVK